MSIFIKVFSLSFSEYYNAAPVILLLLHNGPSSKTPIFFNMTFLSAHGGGRDSSEAMHVYFNAYMYTIYVYGILCTIRHIVRTEHPFSQMGFRIKLRVFVRVKLKRAHQMATVTLKT